MVEELEEQLSKEISHIESTVSRKAEEDTAEVAAHAEHERERILQELRELEIAMKKGDERAAADAAEVSAKESE